MTINFQKVGFKSRNTGKCPVCGKTASRVREFYQTINPWNQKTAEQIMDEERGKLAEWVKTAPVHVKCEKTNRPKEG